MREKFLKYADELISRKNCINIYEDLIKIFDKSCMFHEVGACNEKLWHITQKPELYKTIGDVFSNKIGNFGIAFEAYNRYIQFSDKDFFKNYMRIMKKLGYSGFSDDLDNDDYSREIIGLCDSYDTIVYMMICLYQNKDFDGVIKLDNKLTEIFNRINKYISKHNNCGAKDCLQDNAACRKHLSEILSTNKHHNDLNSLAIKYDTQNKQPYINIIGDYITYKNYKDAILFYNYTYCPAFNIPEKQNIIDICWDISDYYRDKYDFYYAVMFQKYALELELVEVQ